MVPISLVWSRFAWLFHLGVYRVSSSVQSLEILFPGIHGRAGLCHRIQRPRFTVSSDTKRRSVCDRSGALFGEFFGLALGCGQFLQTHSWFFVWRRTHWLGSQIPGWQVMRASSNIFSDQSDLRRVPMRDLWEFCALGPLSLVHCVQETNSSLAILAWKFPTWRGLDICRLFEFSSTLFLCRLRRRGNQELRRCRMRVHASNDSGQVLQHTFNCPLVAALDAATRSVAWAGRTWTLQSHVGRSVISLLVASRHERYTTQMVSMSWCKLTR